MPTQLIFLNTSSLLQMGPMFLFRLLWGRSKAWLKVVRWSEAQQISQHISHHCQLRWWHTLPGNSFVSGSVTITILETIDLNRTKLMSGEGTVSWALCLNEADYQSHGGYRTLIIGVTYTECLSWLHKNKAFLFSSNLGRKMRLYHHQSATANQDVFLGINEFIHISFYIIPICKIYLGGQH